MNKLAVSLILVATTLLVTACTSESEIAQGDIIDGNKTSIIETEDSSKEKDNAGELQEKEVKTNSSNTITMPLQLISSDKKEIKYLEIEEDAPMEEKIEVILSTVSTEYFSGLPIKSNLVKDTVVVELVEGKENKVSWKEDYLNDQVKEYTINTIVKNVLQEEYKGDWINKVELYYNNEVITMN